MKAIRFRDALVTAALCVAVTTFYLLLYIILAQRHIAGSLEAAAEVLSGTPVDLVFIIISIAFSPLLENILLAGLAFLIFRATKNPRAQFISLALGGFVVGLLVHGISILNVGRAFGFSFLSILFQKTEDRSLKSGYFTSVLAHILWNAGSLTLIWLVRTLHV